MGTLKCDSVDVNDPSIVLAILSVVQNELNNSRAYSQLHHVLPSYFSTPGHTLTTNSGWYIILEKKVPIYVGEASNLNSRLNTQTGSCDDFGRKARTSDSQRNVIKKLREINLLTNLRVAIVTQPTLIKKMKLDPASFTVKDRRNIEKILNINRGLLKYK